MQEAAEQFGLANPIFGVDMPLFWPEKSRVIEAEVRGRWADENCAAEALRLASGTKIGACTNLTILAQNQAGLQNLFDVLTWAGTEGYDQNAQAGPRLSENFLLSHSTGLVVLEWWCRWSNLTATRGRA